MPRSALPRYRANGAAAGAPAVPAAGGDVGGYGGRHRGSPRSTRATRAERKQTKPARHPGLPSKYFSINTKETASASNNNHGSKAFIGTEIGFSITAAQRPVFNKQQNQTQQLCVWGSPDAPRGQQHPLTAALPSSSSQGFWAPKGGHHTHTKKSH